MSILIGMNSMIGKEKNEIEKIKGKPSATNILKSP